MCDAGVRLVGRGPVSLKLGPRSLPYWDVAVSVRADGLTVQGLRYIYGVHAGVCLWVCAERKV